MNRSGTFVCPKNASYAKTLPGREQFLRIRIRGEEVLRKLHAVVFVNNFDAEI
jgi:hypothetical protein